MAATAKKVTVKLPVDVLERVRQITGKGITETNVDALRELERSRDRQGLRALRGRVRFELNLNDTRQ